MSWAARARPIERVHAVLAVVAVPMAALLASTPFTVSLAVGLLIGALNFRGLCLQAEGLFSSQLGERGGMWTAFSGLRLVVLATLMLLALRAGADPVALVLGLSMILPACLIGGWRMRPAPGPATLVPVPAPDDPSWDRWNPWLARERADEEEAK